VGNPNIEVLGWLSSGDYVRLDNGRTSEAQQPTASAVVGVLHNPMAKVFFIGYLNCLEKVRQPWSTASSTRSNAWSV
jgi:5-carboxymethyl-2-hydroxymuconate isomerase